MTKHTRMGISVHVIVLVAFSLTIVIGAFSSQAAANRQQQHHTTTTTSSVTLSPQDQETGPEFSLSSSDSTQSNQQQQQQPQVVVSSKNPQYARQFGDTINDIQIECNSDNIVVTLATAHGFNGMIYPKGLSKNSTCMMEYHQTSSNITYYLPLRSCNTMSTDVEDGVEYFNTVMVQPHRRLVTNQGRGYHIKCRYQTKERTITNQEQQLKVNLNHSTPAVVGSASMPACTMKIFGANDLSREVSAENVRIGDELHLVIALDDQDVYGMLVTNCLVRDGMNWGEQPLIDDRGCPIDEDIMPQFNYAKNLTRASVTFQAHKFPYTSSVYYQCNVKLCFRDQSCSHVPPNCDASSSSSNKSPNRNYKSANFNEGTNSIGGNSRSKRWIDGGELDAVASEAVRRPTNSAADPKAMSIEVFSGIHVDESALSGGGEQPAAAGSGADQDPIMMASTSEDAASVASDDGSPQQQQQQQKQAATANRRQSERDFCMSLRKFAIAISLASLLLMLAIIIMIACMIQRRKRRRLAEEAQYAGYGGHRHYDGPYNNQAYLRD